MSGGRESHLSVDQPRQRILLIHRYFWPDSPPYASLLRKIGEHLAGEGHRVTVFSTQPSYKIEVENARRPYRESLGDIDVRRCRMIPEKSRAGWLRAANSVWFAWQILWHLMVHGGRYDIVMCSTVPPVLTGAATSLGSRIRGCRFVYHAMDIWPEVANLSGQMSKGWAYRILRGIDTRTCRKASSIVCLSEDMLRTFLRRDESLDANTQVIGNFELPSYDENSKDVVISGLRKSSDRFRVLFAGNLGRYQALDDVVRAASLVQNPNVEFVLMGAGASLGSLRELAKALGCLDRSLFFMPHQDVTVAKQLMKDADLTLVTLSPGVSSVAYPSKTLTLLAMGCPIGVMMESDCELSQMVRQQGLGFAVDCGDSQGMADAVDRLAESPHELAAIRERVLKVAADRAVPSAVMPAWSRLISKLSASESFSTVEVTA
ncbi:glycosyltransferase family 4 protein [Rhodopirellula sallentina]|uniref:Glycosyl transferase, group 1 n=1 Tax=Rhodopirellula sallentina SM41 TaxID=1263870 RepID=M5UKF8_9BACT|nr:glycosyltransferase family 4 protein [Rhodopirellula sallentina]EMI56508.1 Glycosyl transferase, group 1 [Rhodopirellula sallentina SM41]